MTLRVEHLLPPDAQLVDPRTEAPAPHLLEHGDVLLGILRVHVEMHPVLPHGRLGHPLQDEHRSRRLALRGRQHPVKCSVGSATSV